jgi:sterol desaturase/sphingolipid hydroxylase (fatty acid hydroxylase superfamily)
MEKPIFTVEQVLSMDLPPLILYAAPVMVFFVLVEWYIRTRQLKKNYDGKDGVSAFVIGITNVGVSALIKALSFGVILFFYNMVPWFIPPVWWSYILCIIAIDFCRYWAHRVAHEQRFWWATHVTHHNSEQYNFTVGFRLSWVQQIKLVFFIPVALMGFHPVVFFISNQIEVLYQFWIHTELIKKLPRPIEYIFTTPSHHRVHHGTNDKYLDKNYGSTFIIWDRIFGTFQPEEEETAYGILTPVNSYNPVWLVFHEWVAIFKDLATYRTPKAWWRILFGSPNMTLDKDAYYGGNKSSKLARTPAQVRQSKDEK